MTTRILTPLAAALLLLPAAVALVPVPAAAQRATVVAQYNLITDFDVRGDRNIEPGRELRFRLRGAPYGQAWVDIPNVVGGIALRETRPGQYEGSYVVRQRDDDRAFDRAVATLRANGQTAQAQFELRDDKDRRGNRGWRDNAAPQITDLAPAQGAAVDDNGRVRIGARITDEGRRGGIAPDGITLRVDGRDVTREARLRGDEIEARLDLPRGRHTAELVVRDQAGNVARRAWSFDVVDRQARGVPVVPVVPGAAVIVPGQVGLEILSHPVDAGWDLWHPTPIRGRTTPFATVRLLIDAVDSTRGGNTQVLVSDTTVRADASGHFAIVPRPLATPVPVQITPDFYQLRLISTTGGQSTESQLRLRHRNG